MADYRDRQIGRLSGGQRQRTFLARAWVQEADLYVLDEPMAGVDASSEQAILDVLRTLRDRGKTIVVVHHDLNTVADAFDWMLLLNVRVVAQGPVAEVYTPENLTAAYGAPMTTQAQRAAAMATQVPSQG
jgi:manganese/zinc/iron transport system ATP- binding protein